MADDSPTTAPIWIAWFVWCFSGTALVYSLLPESWHGFGYFGVYVGPWLGFMIGAPLHQHWKDRRAKRSEVERPPLP